MADRLARMLPALAPLGDGAWVVGGAVRDDLRGAPVTDVDVAVAGDAGRAARALAAAHGAGRFRLSGAHGSWRLAGGRLPVQVDITPLQGATLGEDLSRRDFTVNAMAVPVTGRGEIVDPYGGASDLADGVLRQVSDHALDDDPVRVLRAVRLAHQHRLRVEPSTRESARRAAGRLWDAPGERLRAELVDVARLRHADRAFAEMDELGALGVLVPSLEDARGMGQNVFHHKDVLGHTLEVVTHGCDIAADPETLFRGHAARIADDLRQPVADDATRREVLVLACLLHDMAKPATREVTPEGRVTFFHHDRLGAEMATTLLKRLRMAGKVVAAVARLVRTHLVIGFAIHRQPLSMVQVDRVMGLLEPVSTEAFILSAADRMATRGPMSRDVQMARHLRLVYDLADVRDAWTLAAHAPPVLRGDQIADAMGQPPGPWLAQAVEDLRIEGIRRPGLTAERARTFIRSRAAIYGFCQ